MRARRLQLNFDGKFGTAPVAGGGMALDGQASTSLQVVPFKPPDGKYWRWSILQVSYNSPAIAGLLMTVRAFQQNEDSNQSKSIVLFSRVPLDNLLVAPIIAGVTGTLTGNIPTIQGNPPGWIQMDQQVLEVRFHGNSGFTGLTAGVGYQIRCELWESSNLDDLACLTCY